MLFLQRFNNSGRKLLIYVWYYSVLEVPCSHCSVPPPANEGIPHVLRFQVCASNGKKNQKKRKAPKKLGPQGSTSQPPHAIDICFQVVVLVRLPKYLYDVRRTVLYIVCMALGKRPPTASCQRGLGKTLGESKRSRVSEYLVCFKWSTHTCHSCGALNRQARQDQARNGK